MCLSTENHSSLKSEVGSNKRRISLAIVPDSMTSNFKVAGVQNWRIVSKDRSEWKTWLEECTSWPCVKYAGHARVLNRKHARTSAEEQQSSIGMISTDSYYHRRIVALHKKLNTLYLRHFKGILILIRILNNIFIININRSNGIA